MTVQDRLAERAETIERHAEKGKENVLWLLDDAIHFRQAVAEIERIQKVIACRHCATCIEPLEACDLCQVAGKFATEDGA